MVSTVYDLAWLQNWANARTYSNDNGAQSWAVLQEVVPNFPDHALECGPTEDGRYMIKLTGPIINGTVVYINP